MKIYTVLINPSDPERGPYALDYSFTNHENAIKAARETIENLQLEYEDEGHTEIITRKNDQDQIVAFELWQHEDVFLTSVQILTTNLTQED